MEVHFHQSTSDRFKGHATHLRNIPDNKVKSVTNHKDPVSLNLTYLVPRYIILYCVISRMKSLLRILGLHLRRDLPEWSTPLTEKLSTRTRSYQLNLITEGPLIAQKSLRMLIQI